MTATGRKLCRIDLTADERAALEDSADSGKGSKERRRRAEILLLADVARKGGGRADAGIADALRVGTAAAGRVRKRFVLEGTGRLLSAGRRRTGSRGCLTAREMRGWLCRPVRLRRRAGRDSR